jgi:methionine aminopeptidase
MGKRSGFLQVYGKRNKYREVPLNATARARDRLRSICGPINCRSIASIDGSLSAQFEHTVVITEQDGPEILTLP